MPQGSYSAGDALARPAPRGVALHIPRGDSHKSSRFAPTTPGLSTPAFWIVAAIASGAALALGGIAALTIALAVAIGLWAFIKPESALWMSTAFVVFVFVFFRLVPPSGPVLPEEYFYWGYGLLIITAGLGAALFVSRRVDWRLAKNRLRTPASRAMLLMLLVLFVSSIYGVLMGNDSFAVARQFFSSVLLVIYYLLAIAILRTPRDVDLWLGRVRWVVVLGAAWYGLKLALTSFTEGSYYRETSHLAGYAGVIAAVAWNEMLHPRHPSAWLRYGLQLVCCVSAVLMMGNRAAMGSLVVVALFLISLTALRRNVTVLVVACCLALLTGILVPQALERLTQTRGLTGEIATRFFDPLAEDRSYLGRVAQWGVVVERVTEQPILGDGMGGEFTYLAPGESYLWTTTYVDNGWGFVLLKMGLLGLGAFLVLLGVFLRCAFKRLETAGSSRLHVNRLSLLAVLLFGLVSFLSGPTFFHFSGSGFFGAVFGSILVLAEARQQVADAPRAETVFPEKPFGRQRLRFERAEGR